MVARLRGRILVLSLIALLFLALAVQAEPSQVVRAEEILKKIEMGQPVEYNGVTIVGDLDISKLELPKVFVARTYLEKEYFSLTENAKLVVSPIEITGCLILGSLNLKGTVLQENFTCENTQFEGSVYLIGTHFQQVANFGDAWFNQTAYFKDAQFNRDAYFNSAQFNQTAHFNSAQFNQEGHFEDAKFLDVSFNNSLFSEEAFFDNAQINGTLSLYRTKYDKLNIRWSSITDLAYDDTTYYLLIENFKKLGFTDDASECYYSYRYKHLWELLRQGRIDSWFFDLLAWATYGYGLRPVWPLGWSVLFVLLGGAFFFVTKSISRSKGPKPSRNRWRGIQSKDSQFRANDVSIWEAFLLSTTYFTSGASSIISSVPEEFRPLGRSRYVVVILRLLGWIFFVLFLTSLGKIA